MTSTQAKSDSAARAAQHPLRQISFGRTAVSVDRRDWTAFAGCFTDPVHTDYSDLGSPAGTFSRAEFVERVRGVLDGFTHTQHLSPNHLVEFDPADPDRATCDSYMYAQHHLENSESGDAYLIRGSYRTHLLRTPDGWKITHFIQRVTWTDGNENAPTEALARNTTTPS